MQFSLNVPILNKNIILHGEIYLFTSFIYKETDELNFHSANIELDFFKYMRGHWTKKKTYSAFIWSIYFERIYSCISCIFVIFFLLSKTYIHEK